MIGLEGSCEEAGGVVVRVGGRCIAEAVVGHGVIAARHAAHLELIRRGRAACASEGAEVGLEVNAHLERVVAICGLHGESGGAGCHQCHGILVGGSGSHSSCFGPGCCRA